MEITYTTTVDDYVAFNRFIYEKSPIMRQLFYVSWLALPVVVYAAGVIIFGLESSWPFGAFGLVYLVIFPFSFPKTIDWLVKAFANQQGTRGMLGKTTLILTVESLTEVTETTRSEIKWQNINRVEEGGGCLFIFVTGLSAAIVPRHGFTSDEDFKAVKEFVLARMKERPGESNQLLIR